MNRVALAAVLCCAPPAFAQYGGQDQWQSKASAAISIALGERTGAANVKAQALDVKDEYDCVHLALVNLRADVTAWCVANNAFIPPSVYDQYLSLRDGAEQSAYSGSQNISIGDFNFGNGESFFSQANQQYGAGQYQYAYYSASWASNSFITARNAYNSAFSDYFAAATKCQQSYDVLITWFQSVR